MNAMTGEDIKQLRTELGLAQREFGIILGYKARNADQAVYDLESARRGRKVPSHIQPALIMLKAHGVTSLLLYVNAKLAEVEDK